MKQDELVQYLANIMKVVQADNILDPREEAVYVAICKEIKAKKNDINDAEKLANSEDFIPVPVGRFSDKVRNVEDMILVSLADEKIDPAEQKILISFAKKVGITQEQINVIVSEAKNKNREDSSTSICIGCKKEIPSVSKFCPECGVPVQNDTVKGQKLEFDYPATGISIEFAQSTSASFDEAKRYASEAPDFQKCIRNKKEWYLASWKQHQIIEALKLAQSLKGIRNRKVYLDGKAMSWDEIFGFMWCIEHRKEAYKPTEYCFGVDENRLNLWGCRQINMNWVEWANWFSYGQFIRKDIFVFDIKRITHELNTNLHKVRLCPYLRPLLINTVLDLLPEKIKIDSRSGWQYNRNYNESPNAIKVVVKKKEDGYTFTDEFYSDGVRPIGFQVAKDILSKAIQRCGINDINLKSILQ